MACKEFLSKEGLAKRDEGVKKKESKKTQLKACVFWAVCAVIYIVFGSLNMSRYTNAASMNDWFGDFRVYNDSMLTEYYSRASKRNNVKNEHRAIFKINTQADLAYDSCVVPAGHGKKIKDWQFEAIAESYFDECYTDTECWRKGTGWTNLWLTSGIITLL